MPNKEVNPAVSKYLGSGTNRSIAEDAIKT